MAWTLVGSVTFGPNSERVTVGPVEVPTFGGLPIRVRQSAFTPFQFGYCLLSFESLTAFFLMASPMWAGPNFSRFVPVPLAVCSSDDAPTYWPHVRR
jgi:hypothetical protein